MTRRPCAVTQGDIERVVKGARKAGVEIGRIEVNTKSGLIVVTDKKVAETGEQGNDWEGIGDGKDAA